MIATVLIIVITLLNIIVYKLRKILEAKLYEKLSTPSSVVPEQSCRRFSLAEIHLATHNFDDALVIGQGGFGKVYKGVIDYGATTVAMKRLNPMSKQGAPEFWREIEMLSKIRHSHIVSLIGYCDNEDEMILVYEYMVCGTLGDHLYKISRNGGINSTLSWVERLKICIGAARGLDYLHTGTGVKDRIIHRDVKSSNILLDENWTAKISDFGLSKIGPANQPCTHVSTNVKGTIGYLDIEYFLTHRLTRKSDVYAFGVVLFEVLCGRPAVDLRLNAEQRSLAGWAQDCIKEGKLHEIIDPNLIGQILSDSLMAFGKIADQCLHKFSKERPTMGEVVVSLERALALQERIDSSMFEGEIFNTGGAFDNRENVDSSVEQHEVINADYFMEQQEVTNVGNGDANSSQSRVNPTKAMALTRKLRLFFSGKSRGTSGKLEKGQMSPREKISVSQYTNKRLVFFKGCSYAFNLIDLLTASGELLGKGMFSSYKAILEDGTEVVVKRSKEVSVGKREFEQQMEVVGSIKHQNVVGPMAYYYSKDELLLVYDYYSQESFAAMLHGKRGGIPLNWETRLRIAIGAAKGIAIIHAGNGGKLVHGNIKSSNIFMNSQRYGCVSDLDLSSIMHPLAPPSARVAGYQAPEMVGTRKASQPSDVYSFGVLLLELLTGRSPVHATGGDKVVHLVQWVESLVREEWKIEVFDLELMRYSTEEEMVGMLEMLQIAMACVARVADQRPKMVEVVKMILSSVVFDTRIAVGLILG